MKNSYFTNENQLQQWTEAAEGIKDEFGIEKALGYFIGEKFYRHGAVEHSIETEPEDALILGDLMKYFQG